MQPSYVRCKGATISPSKKTHQVTAWAESCVSTKHGQKSFPVRRRRAPKEQRNSTKQRHRVCLFQGRCHMVKRVVTAAPAAQGHRPPRPPGAHLCKQARGLWRRRSQPRWNTSAAFLSLSCALSPWDVRRPGITACISWAETLFLPFNYQNCISVWLTSPLLHYLFEPASFLFDLVSPPFLLGLAKSCAVILCLALLSVTS